MLVEIFVPGYNCGRETHLCHWYTAEGCASSWRETALFFNVPSLLHRYKFVALEFWNRQSCLTAAVFKSELSSLILYTRNFGTCPSCARWNRANWNRAASVMAVYWKQKEGPQALSCFLDRQTGLFRTYNVVVTNPEISCGTVTTWRAVWNTSFVNPRFWTVLTHTVENKGNKGTNTVIPV